MTGAGVVNSEQSDNPRIALRAAIVVTALCLLECIAILFVNHGHFGFTMDDPYIHLAMAEGIVQGHYGINSGEAAAASSSIAYPFLLAPFVMLGFGVSGMLLINVASAAACGWLGVMILAEAPLSLKRLPLFPLSVGAIAIGGNIIGLVFTGLEHTLQVAITLACLLGLIRFLQSGRVPLWWPAALIVAPLVRYECASLLVAGALILLVRKRWIWALSILVAGFGLIGAFGLFLMHLGLPPLPASVLVKSSSAAAGVDHGVAGLLQSVFQKLAENMQDARAFVSLLGLVLFLWPVAKAAHEKPRLSDWDARDLAAAFVGLVILAQLLLGNFVWLPRYEIYLLFLIFFGGAYVYRDVLAAPLANPTRWGVIAFSILFMLLFMRMTALTPGVVKGANNIFEQQYQMHRFVTEVYRAPVAVHDLGWASYQNPSYVLDLEGLGSDTARRAKIEHPGSTEWMQRLAEQHDVRLAMLYENWFEKLPCQWVRVADLYLGHPKIMVPLDHVTFYSIPPGDPAKLAAQIKTFSANLPEGVRFVLAPAKTPGASCPS